MQQFLEQWQQAAATSIGFFWMAFWAFALGYLISSLIQVLVTHERMQRTMGTTGPRSVVLGTFFGFVSSSCSFAALSATRALMQKGAGLVPSIAFLLASTNLVIELGIVIAVFLSWQFVVGEYLGGLLLIGFAWLFVKLTRPRKLMEQVRARLKRAHGDDGDEEAPDWREKVRSWQGWQQIGQTYVMEWQMVWKDVLIGFTVAGIIAAFVPHSFFETLFLGLNSDDGLSFWQVLAQTVVGPVAAFFTFIGSMGNIPLAALLFSEGVSFAGVMAFIFSDLVVLPVLRINAQYYGWKMALYILVLLLSGLVVVSMAMHYGLQWLDLAPTQSGVSIVERDHFQLNYSFYLNLLFGAATVAMLWLWQRQRRQHSGHEHHHDHGGGSPLTQRILLVVASCAALWLIGGGLLALLRG